jgi:hypothetical protein
MKRGVHDLNAELPISVACRSLPAAPSDEPWQDLVRASDGLSALEDFPPYRSTTPCGPPDANAVVCRTVSRDGVCTADLPREFARYRSVSEFAGEQALPYGADAACGSIDLGRRQRAARLAHLRRVRPAPDCQGTRLVCRGQFGVELAHTVYALVPRRSICVCRCFPGRTFAPPKRR